jgi:hypothetical protein
LGIGIGKNLSRIPGSKKHQILDSPILKTCFKYKNIISQNLLRKRWENKNQKKIHSFVTFPTIFSVARRGGTENARRPARSDSPRPPPAPGRRSGTSACFCPPECLKREKKISKLPGPNMICRPFPDENSTILLAVSYIASRKQRANLTFFPQIYKNNTVLPATISFKMQQQQNILDMVQHTYDNRTSFPF